MKRVLFVIGIMFISSTVRAEQRYGFNVWRASVTSTAEQNAVVATGPIVFHGIVVNNPLVGTSINIGSNLNAFLNIDTSSKTVGTPFVYDVTVTTLTYSKTGTAEVTILYDWLIRSQAGQEFIDMR